MIIGLGIDLAEIDRIESMLVRWGERFERRIFTEVERTYCNARAKRAQHYAARFAAKEATLKALGVPKGLSWHDMEVESLQGRPVMNLRGAAGRAMKACNGKSVLVSLTHSVNTAGAVVIIES